MQTILNGVLLAMLVRCGWTVFLSWKLLRHTTLVTAVGWAAAGLAAWASAWTVTACFGGLSDGVRDQLWYWAVVTGVIPPVAVLGAKRPGSGAWNAFVLIPLMLVLGWPALTVWSLQGPGRLQVESPALMGFVLALIMGCGNYLSTRIMVSALLYALAMILALIPFAASVQPLAVSHANLFRAGGVLSLIAACLLGEILSRRTKPLPPGPDRVWTDFREAFGIVWTKRCLDRINQEFAEREQWPARLGAFGVEWTSSEVSSEERGRVEKRMEYALRWMLRRFVNDPWIDERIGQGTPRNTDQPDRISPQTVRES